MKHSFITVFSLATMALASCSNDELVSESTVDSNEIKFNVISNSSSRAKDSYYYTSSLKPNAFYVCANIGGEATNSNYGRAYFSFELQELQNGSTSYVSNVGQRYWPSDDSKLDFYAYYNAYNKYDNEITPTLVTPADGKQYYEISDFALLESEHQQRDFIYAATLDQARTSNGKVNLNFKHALAQLAFKVRCEDPSLIVLVEGLSIYNVTREGTMTFGTVGTNGYNVADPIDPKSSCTWSVADLSKNLNTQKYDVDMNRGGSADKFAYSYVYYKDGVETPIVQDITLSDAGGLMVVPQQYEAWTPSTDQSHVWQGIEAETTSAGVRQSYIGLRCRIYHLKQNADKAVNSENFFEFDGTKLKNTDAVAALAPELKYGGDNGEFKEIFIPMPVMTAGSSRDSWMAGRKYVYTFKIGTGSNGGYDPEGDPVLRAISFVGSIAEWEVVADPIEIKE